MTPRFSIICPHYDGCVSHKDYRRGINSLFAQTFQDFEILAYHDGPFTVEGHDWTHTVKPKCTRKRANCWGNNLIIKGIKAAKGEYLLFFNPDNTLLPHAMEEIDRVINMKPMYDGDTPDMVIFPVRMNGVMTRRLPGPDTGEYKHLMSRIPGAPWYQILTGVPPVMFNVDRMQVVTRRSVWDTEKWSRDEKSDGIVFERLGKKWNYRTVSDVLGEHN